MAIVASLLMALALAGQAALPDQLVVSFSALDKKGQPLADLKPDEVTVVEGGRKQPVARLEPDRRPLDVAIVVDTSVDVQHSYKSDIVPAVLGFLKRLPANSRFSIWGTSDRPKELLALGSDVQAAQDALMGVSPLGSNAAVDTMVAASQGLGTTPDRRQSVVTITTASMREVTIDVSVELQKASMRPVYATVEVIVMDQDPRLENAVRLLTARTAGFHERVFTPMAVETQLRRISDYLGSIYRAAYAPTQDPRTTPLDIAVSRKDAKVKMAQSLSTAW